MAFLFLVIAAAISGISCDEMSDAAVSSKFLFFHFCSLLLSQYIFI